MGNRGAAEKRGNDKRREEEKETMGQATRTLAITEGYRATLGPSHQV